MMKGYMKKMKAKRMLAAFLTALMVLTICMPQTVSAASADDRYIGGTTIQDILTNYQYFIRKDAVLKNHTVGAVAIGGSLAAENTIGDGAQSPSYAGSINSATIGNGAGYGATTRDFYYNTWNTGGDPTSAGFTQNGNFFANQGGIDGIFGSTASGLIAESIGLATQATEVYTCTANSSMGFPVIDITLKAQDMNIEIPYEEFKKAKAINLNIAKIDNLSNYAYTINITGVGNTNITLEGEAWKGVQDTNATDVFVNGKQYAFLGDLSNATRGIECNLSGMKLIWNFPDATGTVYWSAMGGHVVAPQAGVEVTSGRFQGGIIARGFTGTGESHYYPYNAVSGSPQDMVITKKFVDADGKPAEVTSGSATFGLYTDSACATTPIATAIATDIDATTGIGTVRFENVETFGVTNNSTYYIKEISAPDGFSVNKTIYACQVSDGGLVTYCEYGKDANPVYSSASPICENLVDATTDQTGVLIVTVEDKDTREKVENVQITVVDKDGKPVASYNNATKTNSEGIITFKDLAPGDYTVTIGTIPEGYQTPTTYEVEVEVKETSYHTFELEQVKEPITIYFVDTANKPVEVGGWVTVQNTSDLDKDGAPVNEAMSAWITTGGETEFENNLSATYTVSLMKDKTGTYIFPEGYVLADKDLNGNTQDGTATIKVSATDATANNSHTFVFEKQVGNVEVTVKDTSDVLIPNATVEITYPDGTTEERTTDTSGVITYEDVPVGKVTVEIIGAPGYVIPTDDTKDETLTVTKGETAKHIFTLEALPADPNPGTITVITKTPLGTETTEGVAKITIYDANGNVATEDGQTLELKDIAVKVNDKLDYNVAAGTYSVEISISDDNWKTTSKTTQVVNVPEDGTDTAEYVLVPYGDLKITVQESDSTTPVTGANVTVKNSDNEVVYTGKTTGTDIVIQDLPVGDYTVTVTPPYNSNYKETSVTADPVPTVTVGNTTPVVLELTPIRNLTVTVVDADNEAIKIPDISIEVNTIKDGASTPYSGADTDSTGSYVFEKIPVGTYEVKIKSVPDGSGYEIKNEAGYNSTTATVTASQDGTAVLKLLKTVVEDEPTATLNIKIIDVNENVLDFDTDPQVTVTYPNATVGTETVTDGSVTKADTAIGTYNVVLDKTTIPSGYELDASTAASQSVTLEADDNETITFKLKEIPPAPTTGTLKVEIVDEDGNKVSFTADVTATNTTVSSNISVANGEATKELEKGTYAVTIDTTDIPSNYELDTSKSGNTMNRTIVAGNTTIATFYVKEKVVAPTTGTLVIEILDSKDDSKVTFNVDATIANKTDANDNKSVTVTNGESTQTLNVNTYKVTLDEADITAANYELDTTKSASASVDNISITDGGTETVTFYVKEKATTPATATLTIEVVDKDGNNVNGAKVTVTDPSTSSNEKTITGGELLISDLPTGDYSLDITTIPDGYILKPECEKVQEETLAANDSKTVTYVLLQTAEVKVTVNEEGTDEPIPNAKVEVEIGKNPDGTPNVVTGTTDSNGEVTLELPIGNNTIEITDLPDGYEDPTSTNPMEEVVDVKPSPATNEVPFEVVPPVVTPTGTINVTVTDKTTGEILPGATVELQDGSGNAIKDASNNPIRKVTSNTGEVTFSNLADGTYKVEVVAVPDTYKLPTATAGDDTVTISNGNTVNKAYSVYGTGDIVITVYDKTNGKVVTNADVTITGPADSGLSNTAMNTGSTGTLTLEDQIVGDYTITTNGVANYEIYGASDGKVTVSRGQKSEQKFEVVQTADVTVKVVDKADPTKPIEGADVTITDPYGNEKPGTTGTDGTVTFPKQPIGQQQVTIDSVPSTSDNVLPEETEQKITISTSNPGNVEFQLPALDTSSVPGDLVITVVDEKTGAKVPGATVTVKDPQGNVVSNPQGTSTEFTTDADGQITLNGLTPVGNYSVIVNTVPDGYTQPSGAPTKATVVAGQSTTLQVAIKKPVTGGVTSNNPPANNSNNTSNNSVSKAPKTGDISYIPVAVIMMILSALGFAGVMVYRKKTENER